MRHLQQPPSITAGARVPPRPLRQRRVGQPNRVFHMVGLNLKYPACRSGRVIYQGTGDGRDYRRRRASSCKAAISSLGIFYLLFIACKNISSRKEGLGPAGLEATPKLVSQEMTSLCPTITRGLFSLSQCSHTTGACGSQCCSSCHSRLFATLGLGCEKQPSK